MEPKGIEPRTLLLKNILLLMHPLLNKKFFLIKFQPISLQQLCQLGGNEEHFLFAISVTPPRATQGNSDIQIPKKYEEYVDVFDKVKASVLPKHRSYDCPIHLQPGQERSWGPIHKFSPTKLEVLRAYILLRKRTARFVDYRGCSTFNLESFRAHWWGKAFHKN